MRFVELLSWAVWNFTRPRRIVTMVLLGAAGPIFALIMRFAPRTFGADMAYGTVVPLTVYSFTMTLLAILFAGGIVSSEMVAGTIQFPLTRPVPRWKLFLSKWLASALLVSVVVMLSCIVTALFTHGFARLHESGLARDLVIIPIGAATYCSLFSLVSVISTRPWLIALIYVFAWESWVPMVPGDFQKLSIMAHLRALSPHVEATARGDAMELLRALNPDTISATTAWNTLVVINILALAVALGVFMSAEFVPKEEST